MRYRIHGKQHEKPDAEALKHIEASEFGDRVVWGCSIKSISRDGAVEVFHPLSVTIDRDKNRPV